MTMDPPWGDDKRQSRKTVLGCMVLLGAIMVILGLNFRHDSEELTCRMLSSGNEYAIRTCHYACDESPRTLCNSQAFTYYAQIEADGTGDFCQGHWVQMDEECTSAGPSSPQFRADERFTCYVKAKDCATRCSSSWGHDCARFQLKGSDDTLTHFGMVLTVLGVAVISCPCLYVVYLLLATLAPDISRPFRRPPESHTKHLIPDSPIPSDILPLTKSMSSTLRSDPDPDRSADPFAFTYSFGDYPHPLRVSPQQSRNLSLSLPPRRRLSRAVAVPPGHAETETNERPSQEARVSPVQAETSLSNPKASAVSSPGRKRGQTFAQVVTTEPMGHAKYQRKDSAAPPPAPKAGGTTQDPPPLKRAASSAFLPPKSAMRSPSPDKAYKKGVSLLLDAVEVNSETGGAESNRSCRRCGSPCNTHAICGHRLCSACCSVLVSCPVCSIRVDFKIEGGTA